MKIMKMTLLISALMTMPAAYANDFASTKIRRYLRTEPVRAWMGSSEIYNTVSVQNDLEKQQFKVGYLPGRDQQQKTKIFSHSDLDQAKLICPGDSPASDQKYFSFESEGVKDALWLTSLTRMKPLASEEIEKAAEGKTLTKITFAMAAGLLKYFNQNEGFSNVTLLREFSSEQGKEEVMSNIGNWDLESFVPFEAESCNCQRDESQCK